MNILAIETSCDDTCVAILKIKDSRFKMVSNVVSSQVKIHRKWGGVYPTLAKREHQRNLPVVLKKALRQAQDKQKFRKPDFIAVTVGPGLEPCLWTGVNFAKALSEDWKKPIIPVNHIEAHIVANFVRSNFQFLISNFRTIFPAVCLIVSGGHTQLILMEGFEKYKILGETRDDAAGECFDKAARILGLGYPGGPAIAAETAKSRREAMPVKPVNLPRPMIYQKNYDFSFSGLKTAVLYKVRSMKYEETKRKSFIQGICKEIQQAIIDVLIYKTLKAAKNYKAKTIILGGGVAANDELRKQLKKACSTSGFEQLAPPKNLCTDNAAMVAVAAYFDQKKATKDWKEIKANANLRIEENY